MNLRTQERFDWSRDRAKNLEKIGKAFGCDVQRYERACAWGTIAAVWLFALKCLPAWLGKLCVFRRLHDFAFGRSAFDVMSKDLGFSAEAIGALTYLYGDYGLPPDQAPFGLHAMVETHYGGGAYFPTGGSKSVALTIAATIASRGGRCLVRAPVTEIRDDGVVCRGVFLRCRRGVVSNAGAVNTYRLAGLEPPAFAAPSVALLYVFVGLKGGGEDLGLEAANTWIHDGWRPDEAWANFKSLDDTFPVCFLSCGSTKDDAKNDADTSTLQLLVPVHAAWFAEWKAKKVQHRGQAYEDLKTKLADRLLETYLYPRYPKTRGRVAHCVVASPLTTDFYLAANDGATYGLSHAKDRFDPAVQFGDLHTQVKPGLFLVGQDHLTVGVASALLSGVVTATYVDKLAGALALLDAVAFAAG